MVAGNSGLTRQEYGAIHYRLRRDRGAPATCGVCGEGGSTAPIEWANVMGNYRDQSDFISLCKPCHMKFDAAKKQSCARGHDKVPANLAWQSIHNVWICRLCRMAIRTDVQNSGVGRSKLTPDQVDEIRRRLASGDRGCEIAGDYGVSEATISRIKSGARWSQTSPSGKKTWAN